MEPGGELPDERIGFRPLRRDDFPLLGTWLSSAHVAPWWREPHDLPSIEARYGPSIDEEDPTEVFVVERDHEPIGLIQRYLIGDDPAIAVAIQQANRRSWRALEKSGFQRIWAGSLESDDPSDAGPSYVYLRSRP